MENLFDLRLVRTRTAWGAPMIAVFFSMHCLTFRCLAQEAALLDPPELVQWSPPGLPHQTAPRLDDLDGDGLADFVGVGTGSRSFGLLVHGELRQVRQTFEAFSFATAPQLVGDLDGDGWPDLALDAQGRSASREGLISGSVWVMRGGPQLDLSRHLRIDAPGGPDEYFPRTLAAAGDLDGDGRGDLLAWDGQHHKLYGYFGGALEAPGATFAMPEGYISAMVGLGDVESDGFSDVWLSVDNEGERSRGFILHGGPQPRIDRSIQLHGALACGTADLDADGALDLVAWRRDRLRRDPHDHLVVYHKGAIGWRRSFTLRSDHCSPVAAGDLDGDGSPEIAIQAQGYDDRWQELRIVDRRGRVLATVPGVGEVRALAIIDTDGDGHNELLVGQSGAILRFRDPMHAPERIHTWSLR